MKLLLSCMLLALLPGLMLGETMVCPDRPVMEDFDFSRFHGQWYTMMRTGVPDDSKCQRQLIQEGNPSVIIFKYADLNETQYSPVSHEGTIWSTDSPGKLLFTVPSVFPGRESVYWILGTDYDNYAVVFTCYVFKNNNHREYVTVMSRRTSLSDEARTAVDAVLETHNYVANQMLRVSHYSCPFDE